MIKKLFLAGVIPYDKMEAFFKDAMK